jgi:hypothetical protein
MRGGSGDEADTARADADSVDGNPPRFGERQRFGHLAAPGLTVGDSEHGLIGRSSVTRSAGTAAHARNEVSEPRGGREPRCRDARTVPTSTDASIELNPNRPRERCRYSLCTGPHIRCSRTPPNAFVIAARTTSMRHLGTGDWNRCAISTASTGEASPFVVTEATPGSLARVERSQRDGTAGGSA